MSTNYPPELSNFVLIAKQTNRLSKYSIKRNHPLTVLLYEKTSFLPKEVNISERLYYVEFNLYSMVKCASCNNKANFVNKKYNKYCTLCSSNSVEKKEKIKNTMNKNHGVNYYVSSSQFRENRSRTMMLKYGVPHNFQSSELYDKFKNTMIARYGASQSMQVSNIKDKLIKTNIANNGGCGFGSLNNWVETQLKSQSNLGKEELTTLYHNIHHNTEWLSDLYEHHDRSISKMSEDIGISKYILRSALVKQSVIKSKEYISWLEQDVNLYISSLVPQTDIVTNTKKVIYPKELDIFLPKYNLAIELNGLYWHSYVKNTNKLYHKQKTSSCKKYGISLLHIFENEWNNIITQDIWKSMISYRLYATKYSIYARHCTLCIVSYTEQVDFLNHNHLQGYINSSINIGLRFNGELVTLMTFGKSRFNKHYKWELLRFCNKIHTNVIGGAGKCFNFFVKEHPNESVISYANMRYSNGKLYESLGFNFIKESSPNYYYFKYNTSLLSRVQFQKHKLKDKLEVFNPMLTEWQNMRNNGWNKIYDCGNQVWGFIPDP